MILTFVGNLFCCIYLLVSFPWNNFAVKIIESVGNLWYWVSIWRYQLVAAGTGSEYYDAGCHLVEKGPYRAVLVILGQNRAELDISLCHWANIGP